jgi:hypothetical protein
MLPFLAFISTALANDSVAGFDAGGLVFVQNDQVAMVSEDLFLSAREVRVRYEFLNKGPQDLRLLVAFPLPDIHVEAEGDVSIPTGDPDNPFGFTTTFDGRTLPVQAHRYAFAAGVDRAALLSSLGIPLAPHLQATREALAKLPPAQIAELMRLGLVTTMEYDAGQGWQIDYVPAWTLKTTYTWEAIFPAGKPVVVEHSYQPSVGASAGTAVLVPELAGEYRQRYCVDDSFARAVRKAAPEAEGYSVPFMEQTLGYILSTGRNWAGPIGRFHLVVDKGAPGNLVSFCGEGVAKTSPTTFELTAKDFWPVRDLNVLILSPWGS